jgi:hypothetical protein
LEESRRSQRGMSTPAQMATIATYKIALLNNPPLAEPSGRSRAAGQNRVAGRSGRCGHTAPAERPYVTQSNS